MYLKATFFFFLFQGLNSGLRPLQDRCLCCWSKSLLPINLFPISECVTPFLKPCWFHLLDTIFLSPYSHLLRLCIWSTLVHIVSLFQLFFVSDSFIHTKFLKTSQSESKPSDLTFITWEHAFLLLMTYSCMCVVEVFWFRTTIGSCSEDKLVTRPARMIFRKAHKVLGKD